MLATLFLSYLLRIIPFDPELLRTFGVVVIVVLGLTLVIPAFGKILETFVSRLTNFSGRYLPSSGTGFWGGFAIGAALGLVWSPCAGPILATVATLAATQALTISVVLITLAFVAGISIPLYIFALIGHKLLVKTRALSPYTGIFQRVFGVIMILAALAIYTGYDRVLQTKIVETYPACGVFLNSFESSPLITNQLRTLRLGDEKSEKDQLQDSKPIPKSGENTLPHLGAATEFSGIGGWLNTDGKPLTLASLKGKVVLVNFWTYSCINCIRTLPYVTNWYEKYKDQGFVVVGVHTPEFAFEKKQSNVEQALQQYGIQYPVALDNDYTTWTAYENRYWPAHYLVDAKGSIRRTHFGEGKYQETELAIQSLLTEAGQSLDNPAIVQVKSGSQVAVGQTPETYLGNNRFERFISPEKPSVVERRYSLPEVPLLHNWALDGLWRIEEERVISGLAGALELWFKAGKVFLVLAPPNPSEVARVKVYLDGRVIALEDAGADVDAGGMLVVDSDRLYTLADLRSDAVFEHHLRLEFETPGTSAYTFTFGQ